MEEDVQEKIKTGDYILCPHCKKAIYKDEMICPHCHGDVQVKHEDLDK